MVTKKKRALSLLFFIFVCIPLYSSDGEFLKKFVVTDDGVLKKHRRLLPDSKVGREDLKRIGEHVMSQIPLADRSRLNDPVVGLRKKSAPCTYRELMEKVTKQMRAKDPQKLVNESAGFNVRQFLDQLDAYEDKSPHLDARQDALVDERPVGADPYSIRPPVRMLPVSTVYPLAICPQCSNRGEQSVSVQPIFEKSKCKRKQYAATAVLCLAAAGLITDLAIRKKESWIVRGSKSLGRGFTRFWRWLSLRRKKPQGPEVATDNAGTSNSPNDEPASSH